MVVEASAAVVVGSTVVEAKDVVSTSDRAVVVASSVVVGSAVEVSTSIVVVGTIEEPEEEGLHGEPAASWESAKSWRAGCESFMVVTPIGERE